MVNEVIFSILYFSEALLRNIPYQYVLLVKQCQYKILEQKVFWYGIPAYIRPFQAVIISDKQVSIHKCTNACTYTQFITHEQQMQHYRFWIMFTVPVKF
jgi:hypothetical protein